MTPKQAHNTTQDTSDRTTGKTADTGYQLSADLLAARAAGQWHGGNRPASGITSIEIDSLSLIHI